jgi:hypothetical protein
VFVAASFAEVSCSLRGLQVKRDRIDGQVEGVVPKPFNLLIRAPHARPAVVGGELSHLFCKPLDLGATPGVVALAAKNHRRGFRGVVSDVRQFMRQQGAPCCTVGGIGALAEQDAVADRKGAGPQPSG